MDKTFLQYRGGGFEMNIPPAKPYFPEKDIRPILNDIEEVLRSGMLTIWEKTRIFELNFAKYVKSEFAIGVNSGTAALHLALRALDIKKGDEVIVPVNTMAATANAVMYVGARPIFADMNPLTFCIDSNDVSNKITHRTKAVICMHHSGNMCNMDKLIGLCNDERIYLVEDCAHSIGSLFSKKHSGTFGDIGCFSFYPTKLMTTGEGGMITTGDIDLDDKIRIMRDQGKKHFFSYQIVEMGYNYRMPELAAVLGIHQLKHVEEWVKRRNEIAKIYDKTVEKIPFLKSQFVQRNVRHSYYKYQVFCYPRPREEIRKKLKEKGISTSLQYDPLVHQQPYLLKKRYYKQKCPTAEKMTPFIFSLPLYSHMTDEEVKYVCDALESL